MIPHHFLNERSNHKYNIGFQLQPQRLILHLSLESGGG